jgi:fructose-bisphosphate aldolase/2-amino-3,7-dideoxy-D-threo-hept-6-ulosonate synthase
LILFLFLQELLAMMGKQIRIERIIDRNTWKTVIVPMDHGVTVGPIDGLIKMGPTVDMVAEGGANAVIGHVGLPLHGHRRSGKDIGLILHLSGSTSLSPDPNHKVLVNTVQHALKMGADGVSVHINVGADDEARMLADLGKVAVECMEWGMPLLAMMYPRGRRIKDEKSVEVVKHAARVGAELGADIIKCPYTGNSKSFQEVVEGCPVPVVIAGGSKMNDEQTLKMIHGALKAGAAGISMGRNAFQHEDPTSFIRAASAMVHEGLAVQEALKMIRNGGNNGGKKKQ